MKQDKQATPEVDESLQELTRGAEALIYPDEAIPVQRVPTPFAVPDSEFLATKPYSEQFGPAEPRPRIPRKPLKRPKRFYHAPLPSGEHASPAVLLQQHAELLESINYDAFMDISTTGRFGRWDTTLSIHNSANNSRESKTSKNSGSSKNSNEAANAKFAVPKVPDVHARTQATERNPDRERKK